MCLSSNRHENSVVISDGGLYETKGSLKAILVRNLSSDKISGC